ncbi:hypothetical protein [Enterococcus sp. DIV0996a]|uniref:hypothetical protein n=1 Tax=Enterococcus sp. DIV0996a TaxID=2774790 RepID=UPI003F1EE8A1
MKYVEISTAEAFNALAEKRMSKKDILCKNKDDKRLTPLDDYREGLDALLNKKLFVLEDKE